MIRLPHGTYFGTPAAVQRVRGLTVTRTAYAPHARVPLHYHQRPYICLVARGDFQERSRGRIADCGVGAVVWHAAGESHEDRFGAVGGECTNLELGDVWIERLAGEGVRSDDWAHVRGGTASWLAARIQRELSRSDDLTAFAVEALLCALIAELSRSARREGPRPVWLDRVLSRLEQEFRHPPGLAELASDAGVHRGHLVRAFARHMGCSIGEHVRRLRIDWSATQLQLRESPPLSQLAFLAGFADQPHFCRTFKRLTGETPSAYRRAAGPGARCRPRDGKRDA
jgi:AraC-like DNA-binding protein